MESNFIKNIEQKVIRFVDNRKLFNDRDKVLAALSGGADSIFMLYFLKKYKRRFKIDISAVHINHGLRGKEAEADELFCKKICSKLDINLIVVHKNVKTIAAHKKYSLEEAGRIVRYNEFNKICRTQNFDKVVTAHNANDNSESVFLNLCRGAGFNGLSGIAVKRNNIVRPILCLSKEEILKFLELKGISYCTDSSNFNTDYERNFIRHKIIPLIVQNINPSLHRSMLTSSENISTINQFLARYLIPFLSSVKVIADGEVFISNELIKMIPEELLMEFVKIILIQYFNEAENSTNARGIISLLRLENGKRVKLSNNLSAFKERDGILITSKKNFASVQKKIIIGKEIKSLNWKLSVKKISRLPQKFGLNRYIEYIDADKVGTELIVRNWKAGDRFSPLGMESKKKVSDFLTDNKIQSNKKKEQLVLLSDQKIVWLIGLRLDNAFKVTKTTKNYLELKYYESKK